MKPRLKILIAAGIFFVLLAGSMIFSSHVQLQNSVEAYKKLLLARGEKLQFTELIPPSIPTQSNSVDAVRQAFLMLAPSPANIPDGMKMVAPGKALVGWAQPEARGYDFTNSWEDFSREIAADQPAIELLHEVIDRPCLDFQLDYSKGADLLLPHLMPMKRAAQKLDAAAICELHFGDAGAATTNILTLLGLVRKDEAEGLFSSHLVRIAMTSIAVGPTWEMLQATNITDAELAAMQQGWEQMDFLTDATNTFVMERAFGLAEIEKIRASPYEFGRMVSMASSVSSSGSSSSVWAWPPVWDAITEKPRYAVGEAMWRSSWSYSEELRMLQSDSIILETLRTMKTNQNQFYKSDFDAMTSRLSSLGITNAGEAFFRALKIPDLGDVFGGQGLSYAVRRTIQIETACRIVVTAVALKRYQLKHGRLPAKLAELTPEFLASAPIDPMDGKPLHYRQNSDGTFLLYSVGDDGRDDGGDPTNTASGSPSLYWQNFRAHDWVWPQPATPEEVQFFYEHPPK